MSTTHWTDMKDLNKVKSDQRQNSCSTRQIYIYIYKYRGIIE